MSTFAAWSFLIAGFGAPLLHVLLSPSGGPWKAPPESGCPISPRLGWVVIVLFLGPVGWLLFMAKRRRLAEETRVESPRQG